MPKWFPDKSTLSKPAFKSLAQQISTAIRAGILEPGTRLPPQREMAQELGVSLQTVSRAYDELTREKYIQGEIGRGTFVRALQPHDCMPFRAIPSPDSIVELSIYKQVLGDLHEDCIKNTLGSLSHDIPRDVFFSFRPNQGLSRHIQTGIEWLKYCGVTARREQVIITNGVTQATTTALLSVANPGDTIVTEAIGHHSMANLCANLGLKLRGLELDNDGIIPEAFEQECKNGDISALYLIPNLANPTVYLMSEKRRLEIARIADKYNVFILENDVLGPLVTNRPRSFTEIVPERTFYMTSFSKCLMPGLRTGYLVIPRGYLQLVRARQLMTAWMATPLVAEIVSRWVLDGTARKLIHWQRNALQKRNCLATQILGHRKIHCHPNALHLWLPLPGRWRPDPLTSQLMSQGIAVAPSDPFLVNSKVDARAIRICLGAPEIHNLERGLHVIDQLLDQDMEITFNSF